MCCHNYWTSPFQVGSHHIARELVRSGFEVAFISAPVSPFHLMGSWSKELKERLNIFKKGGGYDLDNKIWYYVPASIFTPQNKPLLNSSLVARYWQKTGIGNIFNLLARKGFGEVDLLYFDNCYYSFLMNKIKFKKSVYRIADKSSGFVSTTEHSKTLEKHLASSVDYVAYTARSLEEYVCSLSPKASIYFPNGVFFDHFKNSSHELPPEYLSITKPIVLYVGAIDAWFDFDIINKAAVKMPEVSFVFIGHEKMAREKLTNSKNIIILGSRHYKQIPRYMANADIGIIPFNVAKYSELVNSIHPLKLYEYMACGLPVIASKWRELEFMDTPASLYENEREFLTLIEETIKKLSSADKTGFVDFAARHDWRIKVEELIKKVGI